jgi:putative transposase
VREVISLELGESESEAFWVEFLRSLWARDLAGVRLAASDQHEGLKHAIECGLAGPWQRCPVHYADPPCAGSSPPPRELFQAESGEQARQRMGQVIERWCLPCPGLPPARGRRGGVAGLRCLPEVHWPKLRSTNPLERINCQIGRRSDVVGISPTTSR